jgi:hypothetical protein
MAAKSFSRRSFLLASSSLVALGLAAGAHAGDYSVIIDNDVRMITTNISDLTTEIGKLFPRILTGTDKDMLIALEKTATDVFNASNALWAPADAFPADVPYKPGIEPFVGAVYSYLAALDVISEILHAVLYSKIVPVCIEVCGVVIIVLRALEAGYGIGRPPEMPAGLILTSARHFADQHRLEEALTGLTVPVASRMA